MTSNQKIGYKSLVNNLVEGTLKLWNTFLLFVVEWAPILKVIYREEEIRVNRSD